MSESAREFSPCSHTLGLHRAIALTQKFRCHLIERDDQACDFIVARGWFIHLALPISCGDLFGCRGESLDGTADPAGPPSTGDNAERNTRERNQQGSISYSTLQSS